MHGGIRGEHGISQRVLDGGLLFVAALAMCGCAGGPAGEVGATLNDKSGVAIAEVPEAVLAAARAARPDLTFSEAEREVRNGIVYFDVEGTTAAGDEIELDIMQDGAGWRVVEIQRDIGAGDLPDAVRTVLFENAPGIVPARIIESDQGDGIIIYEVFTRSASGEERKYEVKYDGITAEYLTEEWAH